MIYNVANKTSIFIFLLLTFIFASCSDDIESVNGEWSLISYNSEGSESGVYDGQSYEYTYKSEAKNIDYILKLNDGKFSGMGFYEFEVTSSGTMNPGVMSGNTSEIGLDSFIAYSVTGTFTLMNGKLNTSARVFGYPMEPLQVFERSYVYSIEDNEMVLSENDEGMDVFENGDERTFVNKRISKWVKQ